MKFKIAFLHCYAVDIKYALSGLKQFLASESPLKMLKNAFYFTLKPPFVPKYLNFCLDFSSMPKKSLIRKIKLIRKFMMSQHRKQIIAVHIFSNLSRRKDNETIKFGKFIEYNIRNIFLKKSFTKCSGETIPNPSLKN